MDTALWITPLCFAVRRGPAAAALAVLALAISMQPAFAGAEDRRKPNYLSPLEAEVVREINRARTDPYAYARHLEAWLEHYDGKVRRLPDSKPIATKEGVKAVREAIRYMRSAKALHALEPSRGMSLGARDHVRDMGPWGALGHTGYDDSVADERVNRHGKWGKRIGENIAYGSDQVIVLRLIIDDGVSDRGHRHNLFDPEFYVIGVSFGPHEVYETICVVTLAGDYTE